MTSVTNPDIDTVDYFFPVDPSQNKSLSNHYKETINDMILFFGKSGAWGNDWSTVSLPTNPSQFKSCLRFNTDLNELRFYFYDGTDWQFITISGGGITTTVEGIVITGPGTTTDFGTAPRTQHTLQITGNGNTGSINEIEVALEGRIDDTHDFFELFSVFVKDIPTSETHSHMQNSPIIGLKEIRYNVTFFDVVGDANVDVTITSV